MINHQIVLLLATATLVLSVNGQQPYTSLETHEKELVDLAVSHANKLFNSRHLNYHQVINKEFNTNLNLFRLDVLLKPTECLKTPGASTFTHRPECGFRETQIQIYCFVCVRYRSKPVIDCTSDKVEIGKHQCKRSPGSGSLTERLDLERPDQYNEQLSK